MDMSSDEEAVSNEILSDEQRLALLEKSGKRDRVILFVMAGILVLTLISWLTISLIELFSDDEVVVNNSAQVEELQKQVTGLETQISNLELQLSQQNIQLSAMTGIKANATAAPPASAVPAPAANNDAVQQVARTLIGQEQGFQESLAALKIGMRDLAGMIAGSRSWLDYYNESLDKPLADSQTRVKELQAWSASKGGAPTSRGAPPARQAKPAP